MFGIQKGARFACIAWFFSRGPFYLCVSNGVIGGSADCKDDSRLSLVYTAFLYINFLFRLIEGRASACSFRKMSNFKKNHRENVTYVPYISFFRKKPYILVI
jgi:hypothetical protein